MQNGMHDTRMDSLCSLGRDIPKDTCKLGKIAFVHREPGILWFKIKSKAFWNNHAPRKGQTWRDLGNQLLWYWGAGLKSQGTWQRLSPSSLQEQAVRKKWTAEEFQSAWEHTWPQLSAQRKKSQKSNPAFKNLYQLAKDKLFLECFLQWGPHFSVRMGGSKPKGNSFKSRGEGNWGREGD